jgi:hypothetical protein
MTKGKFRSLFDADEIRQLGVESGLLTADEPEPFLPSDSAGLDFIRARVEDDDEAEVPLRGELVEEEPADYRPPARLPEPYVPTSARPLPIPPRRIQGIAADDGMQTREPTSYGTPVNTFAVGELTIAPEPEPAPTPIPGASTARLPEARIEQAALSIPSMKRPDLDLDTPGQDAASRGIGDARPTMPSVTAPQAAMANSPATDLANAVASAGGHAPWRVMLRASLMSRTSSDSFFATTQGSARLIAMLNQLTERQAGS